MSSLYPINSHPWNTFAVNAGLVDLLEAVGTGVGTATALMTRALNVAVTANGVATEDVTLGITAPIGASGTGLAAASVEPLIFYYGGLPVLISNWDTTEGISPNLIHTMNWADL